MATAEGLMGLGVPAEQALRTGETIVSVTTTAVGQNSAGGLLRGPGNKIVIANIAGVGHAVTLPADAGIGDRVEIYNTGPGGGTGVNAGVVFPQTGGFLNQLIVNDATPLAIDASLVAVKETATRWRVMTSAAIIT